MPAADDILETPAAPRRPLRVVLPSIRDPRLHLSAVILTLQVLGQTVLGFRLSIAQILVSLAVAAVIDLGVSVVKDRAIIWPASGLLTGNSVAFILRVPGTVHGDWWSLHGAPIFAATAAISMLSKYVLRRRGEHVFNPSNLGLVLCFVALGPQATDPQDLWWGPMSSGLAVTYAVILVGGVTIAWRLRLLAMEMAFLAGFAACLALTTSPGHCMTARWHYGPICDGTFWQILVVSPEVLVFAFFMLSDPKTVPSGRVSRVLFGLTVGVLSVALLAPTVTEFWTKIAILGSLTIACALRLPATRWLPRPGSDGDQLRHWAAGVRSLPSLAGVGAVLCVSALALVLDDIPNLVSPGSSELKASAVGGQLLLTGSTLPVRVRIVARAPGSADDPSVSNSGSRQPQLPALPKPLLPDSVTSFDAGMTPAVAAQMEHDLALDLVVEAAAVQDQDPGLAATGAQGDGLQIFQDQINAAKASGQVTVPTYTFDHATFELVRGKKATQAPYLIGLRLQGHVHEVTYDVASQQELSSTDASYDKTWGLQIEGPSGYLIINDYSDLQLA